MSRTVVWMTVLWMSGWGAVGAAETAQPWVEIRAVYGSFSVELLSEGKRLRDSGINAVFVGSRAIGPIVQLSDWGERVPPEQVETVLRYGAARGVIMFHWSGVRKEEEKVERMASYFTSIAANRH